MKRYNRTHEAETGTGGSRRSTFSLVQFCSAGTFTVHGQAGSVANVIYGSVNITAKTKSFMIVQLEI